MFNTLVISHLGIDVNYYVITLVITPNLDASHYSHKNKGNIELLKYTLGNSILPSSTTNYPKVHYKKLLYPYIHGYTFDCK